MTRLLIYKNTFASSPPVTRPIDKIWVFLPFLFATYIAKNNAAPQNLITTLANISPDGFDRWPRSLFADNEFDSRRIISSPVSSERRRANFLSFQTKMQIRRPFNLSLQRIFLFANSIGKSSSRSLKSSALCAVLSRNCSSLARFRGVFCMRRGN